MVLRKAVVALLLLRIIENRRSLNASAILHRLACIRAILSKNPLLASMFAAAEPVVAAVLQRARRQVDCAAVAVQSKLQSHPLLHPITNTSYVRHVLEFLRALIVKIDCALKALAPFARFRIVCSVLRRRAVFEGVCSFKWMDDVQLAVSVDTGFAVPVTTQAAPSGAQQTATLECSDLLNLSVAETGHQGMHFTNVAQDASIAAAKPFSPAPPPPPPPPPLSFMLLPSTPSAPLKSPSLKSPPLMSSPAFAAALQSVVLNKTPKPNPASARSAASPSMSKGDDLMAALVARISARRRRMTNTVAVDDAASKAHDGLHAASDWSDASPADSDGEFSHCPSPKRLAAQIVKSIPWSNGRTRVDPLSAPSSSLRGVNESDVDCGVDCNGRHSRSATPMLFEKALDLSGMDGLDRVNCSGISVSSSSSTSSKTLCIGSLLQPEPFALNDNITSRRGSRGYHVN